MLMYLPSHTIGYCGKEGGVLEYRDVNMSKIPKRGSKVTGYEGGRLPIHNIYGGSKSMEVSDICNLPTLDEVVSDR